MKHRTSVLLSVMTLVSLLLSSLQGQTISEKLKAKLDAVLPELQALAADPVLVKAVKAHNEAAADTYASMTQETWNSTAAQAPVISSFTKNEAAMVLKAKKTEKMSELILSGSDGTKVAFLAKPSNWSHKGKPKHDQPMAGKVWHGSIEVDQSTGLQQIQVSVPVLHEGAPIGSLIVGLLVSNL